MAVKFLRHASHSVRPAVSLDQSKHVANVSMTLIGCRLTRRKQQICCESPISNNLQAQGAPLHPRSKIDFLFAFHKKAIELFSILIFNFKFFVNEARSRSMFSSCLNFSSPKLNTFCPNFLLL